jgi:hypothetical protein
MYFYGSRRIVPPEIQEAIAPDPIAAIEPRTVGPATTSRRCRSRRARRLAADLRNAEEIPR